MIGHLLFCQAFHHRITLGWGSRPFCNSFIQFHKHGVMYVSWEFHIYMYAHMCMNRASNEIVGIFSVQLNKLPFILSICGLILWGSCGLLHLVNWVNHSFYLHSICDAHCFCQALSWINIMLHHIAQRGGSWPFCNSLWTDNIVEKL